MGKFRVNIKAQHKDFETEDAAKEFIKNIVNAGTLYIEVSEIKDKKK